MLYVVGGLYGNLAALDAVERPRRAGDGAGTLVFNGDFHWFDAEPQWFAAIDAAVSAGTGRCAAMSRPSSRAGRRRRRLRLRLPGVGRRGRGAALERDPRRAARDVAHGSPARRRLAALPMHLVAQVGDAAGRHRPRRRRLARRLALRTRHARRAVAAPLARRRSPRLAASTCSLRPTPAWPRCAISSSPPAASVVNNGAAGMPNFCRHARSAWSRASPPALAARAALRAGRATACTLTPAARTTTRARSWTASWRAGRRARRPMRRISSASPAARTTQSASPHRDKIASRCPRLSIIIPALNEETGIADALEALTPLRTTRHRGHRGRRRQPRRHHRNAPGRLPTACSSRAARARRADECRRRGRIGDVLLFLHADTPLPADADDVVLDGLAGSAATGAASTS